MRVQTGCDALNPIRWDPDAGHFPLDGINGMEQTNWKGKILCIPTTTISRAQVVRSDDDDSRAFLTTLYTPEKGRKEVGQMVAGLGLQVDDVVRVSLSSPAPLPKASSMNPHAAIAQISPKCKPQPVRIEKPLIPAFSWHTAPAIRVSFFSK